MQCGAGRDICPTPKAAANEARAVRFPTPTALRESAASQDLCSMSSRVCCSPQAASTQSASFNNASPTEPTGMSTKPSWVAQEIPEEHGYEWADVNGPSHRLEAYFGQATRWSGDADAFKRAKKPGAIRNQWSPSRLTRNPQYDSARRRCPPKRAGTEGVRRCHVTLDATSRRHATPAAHRPARRRMWPGHFRSYRCPTARAHAASALLTMRIRCSWGQRAGRGEHPSSTAYGEP